MHQVVSPLLASYEADIDKAMAEGRVKLGDLVGHHSQSLKVAARDWSGKASVALKNVQQKVRAVCMIADLECWL